MAKKKCFVVNTLERKTACVTGNITGLGVFPNGIDANLNIASLGNKAYLDALAMLEESAVNRLVIMKKAEFEESEPTSGEISLTEFAYGKKTVNNSTYGGNKLTLINTEAARKTFKKLSGNQMPMIYFYGDAKLGGVESGKTSTVKPFEAIFAISAGFKDTTGIITVEVLYAEEDYELNKKVVSLPYKWTEITSIAGLYFEIVSSSTASVVFTVADASGSLVTDSDLTTGASGTHQFDVTKSGTSEAGAVTYDSSTGNFTFTPTVAFSSSDVIKTGYNQPSVSAEKWITNEYDTVTI